MSSRRLLPARFESQARRIRNACPSHTGGTHLKCAPSGTRSAGRPAGVSLVGAMANSAEVPAGQRAGRDRKGKPQKGTFKQRGELAEMRFMLKAAGLGFGVAKPWGDSERYDFALDTGKRFVRVQVKSTYHAPSHGYIVNATGSSDGKKKTYTAEQIDFLVAYIVAEEAWYVVSSCGLHSTPSIETLSFRL